MTTEKSADAERRALIDVVEKIVATLFAATGVGVLLFFVFLSMNFIGKISDLPEYYAPAKMVLDGHGAEAYTLTGIGDAQHKLFSDMNGRVVALFVPPQGLALITPIGFVPKDIIHYVWKGMLLGSLIGAFVLLQKTFSLGYKQTCYLVAGVTLSAACFEALRIDQMAPFLLLSYVASIYCLQRKRDIPAGVWLVLMVLKPQQFLPFLAFLAGTKRWKTLAVCGAGFLVLTVIAFALIGQTGMQNYSALVSSPDSVKYMQPELTPTLRGQLLRIIPSAASTIFSATSAVYLLVIAIAFALGRRFANHEKSILLGVLTVMPLALVLSMHCHNYDLLLITPTILLLFSDKVIAFNSGWKLATIYAGSIFLLPVALNVHNDYLMKGGVLNPYFFLLLIFGVAMIIYVLRNFKKPLTETQQS
ncbi:MAG: DUF2029 domain-containing protein [Leptolyngbya sp.]|nr:DUF2029 domain-containing protein [Candidatus Melainabacteria bacterium]